MNNKELLVELSNRLGKTQKEVSAMLDVTTDCMVRSFTENSNLVLQGFGAFEVRKKADRILVNPATKLQMIVPPKLALIFKASNTYKDKIKNKEHNGK